MILRQIVAELVDSAGWTRFTYFYAVLRWVAFCSRLDWANVVISGAFVGPIVPDNAVKFHDPDMKCSREIPPKNHLRPNFRPLYRDNCRSWVAGDVRSGGAAVDEVGVDSWNTLRLIDCVPMFVYYPVGSLKVWAFENFERRGVSPNPTNWWAFLLCFYGSAVRADCASLRRSTLEHWRYPLLLFVDLTTVPPASDELAYSDGMLMFNAHVLLLLLFVGGHGAAVFEGPL